MKWGKIIKNGIYSSLIFSSIVGIVMLTSTKTDTGALSYYDRFSQSTGNQIYEKYIDMFLGAPILSPSLFAEFSDPPFPYPSIIFDYYHYWWQYSTIGIIYAFVLLTIVLAYKNKFVQMLCAFMSVDIAIHIIMKFGINDLYIYAAHWIYIIPIFLGWLYIKLPKTALKPYIYIISTICVVIMVNNIIRLKEFIELAQKIYPVN